VPAEGAPRAGHYDTVPHSFGAADDGSAVATLLETARALTSSPALRRDVTFLFTDGEELGLLGAQGFAQEHPWRGEVGLVLNFDARGTSGTATTFETSASSAVTALARCIPNGTDLTAFNNAATRAWASPSPSSSPTTTRPGPSTASQCRTWCGSRRSSTRS